MENEAPVESPAVVGPPEPTEQQAKVAALLKKYKPEHIALELQVNVGSVYRWMAGSGISKTHLRKLKELK